MFGKLFGKNKEEDKKRKFSGDLSLNDLQKGDFLDYFMRSWEVKDVTLFDWGNNDFSKELTLNNGKEEKYLSIDSEIDVDLVLSEKISILDLDTNIAGHFRERNDPPETLIYKNTTYTLSEESQGHFISEEDHNNGLDNWTTFVNFDYRGRLGREFLTIVQLGQQEFLAYAGNEVKSIEFSNFIPRN